MSGLTDEMRTAMSAINAGISHVRRGPATAKYLRYVDGKPVWDQDPAPVRKHSMFPYKSTSMAVDPSEVPEVQEQLRRNGVFAEFDNEGRPIITSAKQHRDLAKALGMNTGRDGYGHTDEMGKFHNSGRRRTAEMQEGRGRVRRVIEKLESMPEEMPAAAVADALGEYDIFPNQENTG